MALAGGVLRVVVVVGVLAHDLERRQDLDLGRGEDADRDLDAGHETLGEDAVVVAAGEHDTVGDLLLAPGQRVAHARALPGRLDDQGKPQAIDQPRRRYSAS